MKIKKLYDKNGLLFAEIKYSDKINADVSKHYHCMFSMAAIKTGTVSIEIEAKEAITLHEKSLVLFNPEQVHRSKFSDKKTKGFYELYLSTPWCTDIQNEIYGENLEYIDIDTNILNSEKTYKKFIALLQAVLKDKKGLNFENVFKSFMREIFEEMCDINYLSKKENPYYNIINKARQYILRNIHRDITLDMLSNYLGFSKSYIIRIFKNVYGQTPYAYVLNLKINKAKMLISTSNKVNLGDIAKDVGFYDQSHFTKSFRKIYGVNPKLYKS